MRLSGIRFFLSFGYPEKPDALTWVKRSGGRKPLEAVVIYEWCSPL